MAQDDYQKRIKDKIVKDAEENIEKGENNITGFERKYQVKVEPGSRFRREKKEISWGEISDIYPNSLMNSKENLLFVTVLGVTLALINDFFDLIFWHTISLIGAGLDITLIFLFLLILSFFSRLLIISILIIILVFILEIIPVIGVFPWWTMGMVLWYGTNRKNDSA